MQALAELEGTGIAKVLFNKESGEVLGVHIIGIHASDLIQVGFLNVCMYVSALSTRVCLFQMRVENECLGRL